MHYGLRGGIGPFGASVSNKGLTVGVGPAFVGGRWPRLGRRSRSQHPGGSGFAAAFLFGLIFVGVFSIAWVIGKITGWNVPLLVFGLTVGVPLAVVVVEGWRNMRREVAAFKRVEALAVTDPDRFALVAQERDVLMGGGVDAIKASAMAAWKFDV